MRKSLQWTLLLSGLAALGMASGASAEGLGQDGVPGPGGAEGGTPGLGVAKGRPARGHADLAPPEGAADEDATGKVRVRHFGTVGKRSERSWFRVQVANLEANTEYSVHASNPDGSGLTSIGTITTGDGGGGNLKFDTKKGGTLPFGAALADLAGGTIEVHDGAGVVVLAGTIPAAE